MLKVNVIVIQIVEEVVVMMIAVVVGMVAVTIVVVAGVVDWNAIIAVRKVILPGTAEKDVIVIMVADVIAAETADAEIVDQDLVVVIDGPDQDLGAVKKEVDQDHRFSGPGLNPY